MRNIIFMMAVIITVNIFASVAIGEKCQSEKDAVESAKEAVKTAQAAYDEAAAKARVNVVVGILSEIGTMRGSTPGTTSSQSANNLAPAAKSESSRITLERALDAAKQKLSDAENALNNCLYDKCISCNNNVPKGQPYYHYVFCSDYMYQVHYESYPTGKYWSCSSSESSTHASRTCSRSAYGGGSGERCGQTYRNCNPRVCKYTRSYSSSTLYCSENSY